MTPFAGWGARFQKALSAIFLPGKAALLRAAQNFGEVPDREYAPGEMEDIARRARFFCCEESWDVDDTTWNDLELSDVFARVNAARTHPGDEALYCMLRSPARCADELSARKEILRWAACHPDARLRAALALARAGRPRRAELSKIFKAPLTLPRRAPQCVLLIALLLACTAASAAGLLPVFIPILLGVVNAAFSLYLHAKNSLSVDALMYLLALTDAALTIGKEKEEAASPAFVRLYVLMPSLRKLSDHGFFSFFYENNPFALIISHVFLTEALAYEWFARRVERHKAALREMTLALGEIDACIAVASFRASLPIWCEPAWTPERRLRVRGLVHPLIRNAVPNDIDMYGHALLTGSNAAGKSTFIKAIAVSALMAQSILTCTSDVYEGCFFHIATSMAVRDNLLGGESYFVVEVRALKRLIDYGGRLPGLFAIDEVLRGTNTAERVAASCEFLRALAGHNCLCVAATHDLELTYLLEEEYRNLHFSETLAQSGMAFDYKLRPGRSTSRNAIALMERMGFPDDIVKKAREAAGAAVDEICIAAEKGRSEHGAPL